MTETPYTPLQRRLSLQTVQMIQRRRKNEYKELIHYYYGRIKEIDADLKILDYEINRIDANLKNEEDSE